MNFYLKRVRLKFNIIFFMTLRTILLVFFVSVVNVQSDDSDGDGIPNSQDNCTAWYNPNQTDSNNDGIGDACSLDPNDPSNYKRIISLNNYPQGYTKFSFNVRLMDTYDFGGHPLRDFDSNGINEIPMRVKEGVFGVGHTPLPSRYKYLEIDSNLNYSFQISLNNLYVGERNFKYGDEQYVFVTEGDPILFHKYSEEMKDRYFNNLISSGYSQNDFLRVTKDIDNEDLLYPYIFHVQEKSNNQYRFNRDKVIWDPIVQSNPNLKFGQEYNAVTSDLDLDGDLDIIVSGQIVFTESFTTFNGDYIMGGDTYDRVIHLFERNDQGGFNNHLVDVSLMNEVSPHTSISGVHWSGILIDKDNDGVENELLIETKTLRSELWDEVSGEINSGVDLNDFSNYETSLSVITIDLENKRISSFEKIMEQSEFRDRNPELPPHTFLKFEHPSRELFLIRFASSGGSPESLTDIPHQKLKIFEIIDSSIIDVSEEFFQNDENYTTSLDNDGRVYFKDLDNDGFLDIMIQSGPEYQTARSGNTHNQVIDFLNNNPGWGGLSEITYFKNLNNQEFILTSLVDFGPEYHHNLNLSNEPNFGDMNWFLNKQNKYSPFDLNNDNKLDFVGTSDVEYPSLYVSGSIKDSLLSYDIHPQGVYFEPSEYQPENFRVLISNSNLPEFNFSDTINIDIDERFMLKFRFENPFGNSYWSEIHPFNEPFYVDPLYIKSGSNLSSYLSKSEYNDLNQSKTLINYNEYKNVLVNHVRKRGDTYVTLLDTLTITRKNIPPSDFLCISKNQDNEDVKIRFEYSFDLNAFGNNAWVNGGSFGPRYGYQLIRESEVVEDQLFNTTRGLNIEGRELIEAVIQNRTLSEYDDILIYAQDVNETNIKTFALDPDQLDSDQDGVNDSQDQCLNTSPYVPVDINGCEIFNLPNNNYTISLESLSCIGENDGSISVSVEDEDLNYTLRVNGENPVDLNSSEGYQQTLSNLSHGTYQLCFTVEGESGYNQCFDVNITEPAPLSASSKVDKVGKSISFSLDGSDRYTIVHNGVERVFDVSSPEIPLKKGVNFIEVKTDKLCQGTYTEEIFISEKVEFYPNPTTDVVNLYIHGKDKTVDLKIVDRDGNIIRTSCRDIQSNRKVQVNLEKYPKGVYLIQVKGETINKTVKVIKH